MPSSVFVKINFISSLQSEPFCPLSLGFSQANMAPVFQGLDDLSPEDRNLFNQYGCGRSKPKPFNLVHKAFEYWADIIPSYQAASQNGYFITYGQLDRHANLLSNLLIRDGLKPRERVCIAAQRSIPMLVAILATLKSGCQYVPMDGGVVTEETMAHIFSDTEAPVIICMEKFEEKVKRNSSAWQRIHILDVIHEEDSATRQLMQRPNVPVDEKDGAYIIYTSGTVQPSETFNHWIDQLTLNRDYGQA